MEDTKIASKVCMHKESLYMVALSTKPNFAVSFTSPI